jgi:hypothetical protein
MTLKELLAFFESYYGEKYTGTFLDVMVSYLENCSENFYSAAAKVIIKRFSRIHNKAPDPAEIEKNMNEILAELNTSKLLPEPYQELSDSDIKEWQEMYERFLERIQGGVYES